MNPPEAVRGGVTRPSGERCTTPIPFARLVGDMADFTLLEIDVDVDSVTAKAHAYAPFAKAVHEGGTDENDERGTGASVDVEESSGGRSKAKLAAAVVGLVFLVVAAVVLKRRFTEDDETEDAETAPVTIE